MGNQDFIENSSLPPTIPPIQGATLADLIHAYQTDPASPYHAQRYVSRQNADSRLKLIGLAYGSVPLVEIEARTLLRWHELCSSNGRITSAHGKMRQVRSLFGYGAIFWGSRNDPARKECRRLKEDASDMRFQMGGRRSERLTADQVAAVIARAHQEGCHSVALAQAFQFECAFRQKDCIGEWVPLSEPGITDVICRREKWLRGLRWEEIDADLILRHVTSKKGKLIVIDLKLAPMVMAEFARMGERPSVGPIIVSEATDLPYRAKTFRATWRPIARAAGVPDKTFNMDSRSGAISEAIKAGAKMEHVRHMATHSNMQTTQGYDRSGVDVVSGVMKLRAADRGA